MMTESEFVPVRSYSHFINKLIRAGRNDGIKFYFKFGSEIDRSDFINYSNKFIEDYYATVSPEFAITHPMKFSFGVITDDGLIKLNKDINSREVVKFPGLNGGLLYIKKKNSEKEDDYTLDGSIFRQACLVRRERAKYKMTVIGLVIAVVTLALSIILKK
jgi:hypothetical protein